MFIRVTKDNATKDRGFVAVDAICSVFENRDRHNVSIMTMDGLWYDVVDDIEKLWKLVEDRPTTKPNMEAIATKQEYCRRKRVLAAPCVEKLPSHTEDKSSVKTDKTKKPWLSKNIKKKGNPFRDDLPMGVGEGQHEIKEEAVDVFVPSTGLMEIL